MSWPFDGLACDVTVCAESILQTRFLLIDWLWTQIVQNIPVRQRVCTIYGTGVIGSFCEPYVVERLVDRGSYATCMYALGGFLLVQSAMIFGCTGGLV